MFVLNKIRSILYSGEDRGAANTNLSTRREVPVDKSGGYSGISPPLPAILAAKSVGVLVINNLTGAVALNTSVIFRITIHYATFSTTTSS
jgi:hypothetical protein